MRTRAAIPLEAYGDSDLFHDLGIEAVDQSPWVEEADGLSKYGVAPFDVLDARSGRWQSRKAEWLALGIRGEVSEDDEPVEGEPVSLRSRDGRGGDLIGGLARVAFFEKDGVTKKAPLDYQGTSIFDPVLCELMYRWYSRQGDRILDPWAGGSVRGIVASRLARRYLGIELRPEQIISNITQLPLAGTPRPEWLNGDSREELVRLHGEGERYDFALGCPPYYSLERYSDDPRDLSTMTRDEFDAAYAANLAAVVDCLADDRFLVLVVGSVRDPKTRRMIDLAGVTTRAVEAAGAYLVNDAVLLTVVGTLAIRTERSWVRTRAMGKSHQQVLVFCKGDRKTAAERLGLVDGGVFL